MILISLLCIGTQFLFHSFQLAYYLILALAAAGIILLFTYKNRKTNLNLLFSAGFFSFLLIALFVILADNNRIFSGWDELQHWGKMVKEMIRLNAFYNAEGSMLPHNLDYPPFISCFELFWVHFAGGYSEMNISVGLHVFLFSLIIPVILDDRPRTAPLLSRIIRAVAVTLSVLFTIMLFDAEHMLFTIYTDVFIAVIFVYCLYLVYTKEAMETWYGLAAFSIGLTGLILSKQICVLFVLVCAVAYILTALFFVDGWKEKGIALLKLLGALILPFACYFGWSAYLTSIGITATYSSDTPVTASELFGLFKNEGDPVRVEVCQNILTLAKTESFINTSLFKLSYHAVMILGCLLLIVHGFLFRKEKAIFKDIVYAAGTTLAGYIYLLAMVYVYAFFFLEETSAIGSLKRYLSTATIFIILFAVAVYLRSLLKAKKWKSLALPFIPALCMFLLNPGIFALELPDHSGVNPNQRYKDVADFLQEHMNQDERVCIIFTSPYVNDYRMMVNYYLDGIFVNGNSKNIMGVEFADNPEQVDGMGSRFAAADYVYIQDATGTFGWNCRQYVDNEEYVIGGLYKVDTEPEVKLHLVEVNPNNPDPKFWE